MNLLSALVNALDVLDNAEGSTYEEIMSCIQQKQFYDFKNSRTPHASLSNRANVLLAKASEVLVEERCPLVILRPDKSARLKLGVLTEAEWRALKIDPLPRTTDKSIVPIKPRRTPESRPVVKARPLIITATVKAATPTWSPLQERNTHLDNVSQKRPLDRRLNGSKVVSSRHNNVTELEKPGLPIPQRETGHRHKRKHWQQISDEVWGLVQSESVGASDRMNRLLGKLAARVKQARTRLENAEQGNTGSIEQEPISEVHNLDEICL